GTGATIVAAASKDSIKVAQRAPGGGWSAPATIPASGYVQLEVATSARGDAVIAWVESRKGLRGRVRAALKPAGAATWAVQTLTTPVGEQGDVQVKAGM